MIICLAAISYTNAATIDNGVAPQPTTTANEVTYESLTLGQQQFIDGFINSLYYKMNYQTDAYYIQDIISDLTKLKAKQPKLKDIITVTIDRLKSNYATDLASLADQNDWLDPIRTVTTNKQYIMSKKQFIKSFKEKALQTLGNYPDVTLKKTLVWQMKNQLDRLSGSLTKEEINQLKNHVDSISTPPTSWVDYSVILSSLSSLSPNGNSVIANKFVEWTITDADLVYTISSKQVEYTGAVVLDLFTNMIYRLNAGINFNALSDANIKSTVSNGTIIQVLVTITNQSAFNQMLPTGNPILKDTKNMQHEWWYYSSSYNFIKPQEKITIPYYFIIDKWASVEYVAYQWPFTNSQWAYLIETK